MERVMAQAELTLAKLTSVPTEMEAGIIVAELEEHGIRATMTGIHTANFRAEAPGQVSVLVDSRDLDLARATLVKLRLGQQVDWSHEEFDDEGEQDEEGDEASPSPWMTWRRICLFLVALYLVWFAVGMLSQVAVFLWGVGKSLGGG